MGRSPSAIRSQDLLFPADASAGQSDLLKLVSRTVASAGRTARRKKLIAFGWYGGKFSHLDWLLPLLPACHHYCEPFGGSRRSTSQSLAVAGGDLQRPRR